VNQESDISDSDLEDVDDIMRCVFGDDKGADMDCSYDSETSSGDEGNSKGPCKTWTLDWTGLWTGLEWTDQNSCLQTVNAAKATTAFSSSASS